MKEKEENVIPAGIKSEDDIMEQIVKLIAKNHKKNTDERFLVNVNDKGEIKILEQTEIQEK